MSERLEIKAWQDPETGLTWHYWLDKTTSIIFDDAQAISPQEDGRPTIPAETEGEVRVPEKIEDLNVGFIAEAAFRGCARLTRIVLPSQLEAIDDEAFAGCVALQEICLPKPLFSIGKKAFKGCTSLRVLHSNRAGWLSIDADAFSGCTSLQEVHLDAEGCWDLRIWGGAFQGCTSLREVMLPLDADVLIERGAFKGCTALRRVVIPFATKGDLDTLAKECFEPTTELIRGERPANYDKEHGFWDKF